MEKISIQNRKGQKVVVVVDGTEHQRGLVFLAHGLGSSKDSPRLKIIAESFLEKGFTAVRFDTTNTFGESDGNYEDSTFTTYYEDLEDVIEWARAQEWYQEPFVLVGSSFGGKSTTYYAENYPERVLALVPLATGISGALRIEARERREAGRIQQWKESGWKEEKSSSYPERVYRMPWSHMEDDLKYDTLRGAHKLTMPTLFIVGDKDETTPQDHIQKLYDAVPAGKKEMHVVAGMGHVFGEEFFPEVKKIYSDWIDTIL